MNSHAPRSRIICNWEQGISVCVKYEQQYRGVNTAPTHHSIQWISRSLTFLFSPPFFVSYVCTEVHMIDIYHTVGFSPSQLDNLVFQAGRAFAWLQGKPATLLNAYGVCRRENDDDEVLMHSDWSSWEMNLRNNRGREHQATAWSDRVRSDNIISLHSMERPWGDACRPVGWT